MWTTRGSKWKPSRRVLANVGQEAKLALLAVATDGPAMAGQEYQNMLPRLICLDEVLTQLVK